VHALLGALVLVVGGIVIARAEVVRPDGIFLMVASGVSLTLAGLAERRRSLLLQAGLPMLGLGLGTLVANAYPVLEASVEPFVLGGLGVGLMAAEAVSPGRTAWGASITLVLAGIGAAAVDAFSPSPELFPSGGRPPSWWVFGVVQAAAGAALFMAAGFGWSLPQPARRQGLVETRHCDPDAVAVRQTLAGGVVFAGGLIAVLVNLGRQSLLEMVAALGAAYLLAGLVDRRRRRYVDSGAALLALGIATKLSSAAVLEPYFEATVFGCFGLALLILQGVRPGPHAGFGRSLLTVGIVFAALELLPQYINAPGLWAAAFQGWLFGVLAAVSGAWLAFRAWLRPAPRRLAWGRSSPSPERN